MSSSVDPDVKELLSELIDTVSEESIEVKESDGSTSASSAIDVSDLVEEPESDSTVQKDDSLESETKPTSKHQRKFVRKKSKSVSESESEIESQTKNIRRKFGSEGEVLSICEKIFPPEQQKELNEAIAKYIDKLIKDSIFKSVRDADLSNLLHEDIIGDISNHKNLKSSESEEEFIVEQRLSSHSISELVELENSGENDNEKKDNHFLFLHSENNGKDSEIEIMEDEASFGGYLADLDDTTSVDDLKSFDEDSLNNSFCSGLESKIITYNNSEEFSEKPICNIDGTGSFQSSDQINANNTEIINVQNENNEKTEQKNISQLENNIHVQNETNLVSPESFNKPKVDHQSGENFNKDALDISFQKNLDEKKQQSLLDKSICEQNRKQSSIESAHDSDKALSEVRNTDNKDHKVTSTENIDENVNLIVMSPEDESLLLKNESKTEENEITPLDIDEGLPQQITSEDERTKINWKVGNLHVKLPHKTRGKAHLKAWKKRRVVIQPDEFVNDPKNPSLVISVYGSDSKKHETTFWYSVSSLKATVFRSSSRTHRYAFTISEGSQAIIHLSAENESATQEWIAAIRAVLWPPSSFMELEKMLSGREFEVSIIDNEFSYHCGLLGMYGYLSITPKKLILIHPQHGYVIQEWYLNTVDKFQFVPQPKAQDAYKVLCMSTCSDSSTGQGDIIFFCNESVTLLQSLASNIHQVLSYHSKQEGGKYKKELEDIAEWLVAPPQDCLNIEAGSDEHYKVPPRQVKSLLDIPNFIFNKSLSPVSSAIYPAPNSEVMEPLDAIRNKQTTTSHDSGISSCISSEDFLNCSITSFVIGGGPMTGKSSDSELSDAYTPPRTPEVKKKVQYEVVKEEISVIDD